MTDTPITSEELEALVKKLCRQLDFALNMNIKMNALFIAIEMAADGSIDDNSFTISSLAGIGKQFSSNACQLLDWNTSEEVLKDFELMMSGAKVH